MVRGFVSTRRVKSLALDDLCLAKESVHGQLKIKANLFDKIVVLLKN